MRRDTTERHRPQYQSSIFSTEPWVRPRQAKQYSAGHRSQHMRSPPLSHLQQTSFHTPRLSCLNSRACNTIGRIQSVHAHSTKEHGLTCFATCSRASRMASASCSLSPRFREELAMLSQRPFGSLGSSNGSRCWPSVSILQGREQRGELADVRRACY
jgi:hypothetical protein